MFKYRCLFILLICQLPEWSSSTDNSTSWSAVNLLVDPHRYTHSNPAHTTETIGIVIRSTESISTTVSDSWTKIEVSQPPLVKVSNSTSAKRYHATVGNTVAKVPITTPTPSKDAEIENDFATSVVDGLMNWANRSLAYLNTTATKVPKKGKLGEKGHAFLDEMLEDEDDYDDDEDDDEEDEYEEEYNKKEKDELEEIQETEPTAEEAAETAETEPHEEYDSDAETRPPIILRTRRKNKRKHGKKHGKIKIKHFKKWKKFMLPLLLAYKLKFFTLVPLLLGGLVLIVATTGFAGFFFALFAVGLGMKHNHR